jgi:hypothetical protein
MEEAGIAHDVRRPGEPTAPERALATEAWERLTVDEQVRTVEAGAGVTRLVEATYLLDVVGAGRGHH